MLLMKSISTNVDLGDTPAQRAGLADVNAVMGVKEWGLILILSAVSASLAYTMCR